MIKLSISNIAWPAEADEEMYGNLFRMGYSGLEIAPSRLFGNCPYEKLAQASELANDLLRNYGISVPSMQSIWYGRTENFFRGYRDFEYLIKYSEKAVGFARAIGCKNLVFGCPKNRNIESNVSETDKIVDSFFRKLSSIAVNGGAIFGVEANPLIYNTNYLNTTSEVTELLSRLRVPGLGLNLDVGAMLYNDETIQDIRPFIPIITHVHISEPQLAKIKEREFHRRLLQVLADEGYEGYISIEMGICGSIKEVMEVMLYVKEVAEDVKS